MQPRVDPGSGASPLRRPRARSTVPGGGRDRVRCDASCRSHGSAAEHTASARASHRPRQASIERRSGPDHATSRYATSCSITGA
ncbi:Hypothetical protein A7982_11059 [Minicystis rosea]|nr:Hypothetical protein A7982_11059 [Minicystis rosea]